MNYYCKKWLKKQSLIFKLSLGILAVVLLGVILLLSIISSRSKLIIEEQIFEHSEHSIQAAVDNISHLVSETEQTVKGLSNTLQQLDTNDTSFIKIALNSTIKTIYNSGLDLSHVTVYSFPKKNSSSGTLYSAFAKDDNFFFNKRKTNNFYTMFPQLKGAEKDENIFWSEPYISPNSPDKKMVISCVLPFKFRNEKTFSGLVSISIGLQDIVQHLEKSPFQNGSNLVLLSQNGLYIVHPDSEINMKTTIYELAERLKLPELFQIGKEILSGKSGQMQRPYSSVYHEPTILFYAPVPHLNWGMCLIFSYRQLFKPIYDLQIIIIASAFIFILILLFLINKICVYSIRPLSKIAEIAAQYGKGNFSETLSETYSNDEIGILSTAFNNMRTNFLDYIKKEKKETSERQKDLSELEIARRIQLSVLNSEFPLHNTFQLNALMTPAKQIGGDFYDFFFISKNRIGIVVADVSGKGISAALYMMRAKEIIKHTAQYTSSVAGVFEQVNNALCEGNSICMFVSAFLGIINLKTGVMEYVNAGHLPPFLITDNNCQKLTPKPNFILGIKEGISYQTEKIKLLPNTCIFLYTDGITEAENKTGNFYGEEHLVNVLHQYSGLPDELINAVISDIKNYTRNIPQSDDITMLAFHYNGTVSDVLTIDADIKKLNSVLDFIKRDMQQKQIPQDIQNKVTVAVEELFSNIAFYAYDTVGEVQIKTALNKSKYSLKFIDKGKPYNPLKHQEPDISRPLEERAVGGLGIFIAKKMADSLTYLRENGKNILKIEMIIKKTPD